ADHGVRASRMARDVRQRLLDDQKGLPALFGIQTPRLEAFGDLEGPGDAAALQRVRPEAPDPLDQARDVVLAGVRRPDDVAHRVDEAAGPVADLREKRRLVARAP